MRNIQHPELTKFHLLQNSVPVLEFIYFACFEHTNLTHVLKYYFLQRLEIVIYRVSQEECARLREGVPYVEVYR